MIPSFTIFTALINLMRKSLLFFIFLTVAVKGYTQSGWDFLYGNDLFSARQIFEEDLKKDSLNVNSLLGTMLISEITEDELTFKNSARRLMYAKKDDAHFHTLFSRYAALKTNEILDNKNLTITTKLPYLMDEADDEQYLRHFAASQKIYDENISHLNWSFIGPFSNINGYGFEVPFEIEKESFNATKSYSYKNRTDYKWVTPVNYSPSGAIRFSAYLKDDYSGGVYFANTFVELKEEKKIQIRVSRTEPIKIWVNDDLVYDNWQNVNFEWDGDIVTLTLPAGYNRVLIKYCPGYYYSGKEGGEYGGYGDYDEYAYDEYDYSSYYSSDEDMGLIVRITDTEGNLIPMNSSSTMQNYSKTVLASDHTSGQTLTYFKNNFENNEKDVSALYLYYAAARHAGLADEIEEMLFNKLKAYPGNYIIRYLASSVYSANGKGEIAERTLSSVNLELFPVFSPNIHQQFHVKPANPTV